MPSVYFGGSRSLPLSDSAVSFVASVVQAVVNQNQAVQVGCQFGADQAVVMVAPPSSLVVFAVAPSLGVAPAHVQFAASSGARVVCCAGGSSAPVPAQFLLRSIAALQGCSQAVFFKPGKGSLAVAREALKSGLQVLAFQQSMPAPVPSSPGQWVASSFHSFACWQWSSAQLSLF